MMQATENLLDSPPQAQSAIRAEFERQYARFSQGDLAGFVQDWHPAAVLWLADGLPLSNGASSGSFTGKPAITDFFRGLYQFIGEAGNIKVVNCGRRGDKGLVEWTYQQADQPHWWAIRLRYDQDDQVIEARCYTDMLKLREMLVAAGVTL